MKNPEETKEKKGSYFIPTLVLVVVVICGLFYSSLESPFEKLLLLIVFGAILFPMIPSLIAGSLKLGIQEAKQPNKGSNQASKTRNYTRSNNTTNTKTTSESQTQAKSTYSTIQYKKNYKKTNTNSKTKINPAPSYLNFRNMLIEYSKNKKLDRDAILSLKDELDSHLGAHKHAYDKFNFQNDMHELYVKSKSSKLEESNYVQLIDYLNTLTIKSY